MDLEKINKLKNNFRKSENKTSRNYGTIDVAVERYYILGNVIEKWKRAFYIMCFIVLSLFATSIYLFNSRTVYPYIVRTNSETGQIINTEVLKNSKLELTESEKEYFLKKFVTDVRTVTLDKKYFENSIKKSSNFLTDVTQQKILSTLSQEKINEFFEQKKTRDVEILSFNSLSEKDNFQIRWREREYDSQGNLVKRKNMNAILKISYFVPNANQILENPLGMIITDITIAQEN